ncbi:PqiB family protein [Ketobacter sp.]|nr:MAG: MCE family protein [Ketobacter sp.]
MAEPEYQDALVKEDKAFSIIWLLPLIAVVIGGWLLYRAVVEAPIEISINFPSGTGMEVGKTKVLYEGITAGVVTDIQLDTKDMKGVVATVEIDNRLEVILKESTQFWLVRPEISLSGVTGLETIVTGNYIGVKMGADSERSTRFEALSEPPPIDTEMPGLHLTLHARDLGSIHADAPVLYKQITVGSVTQYQLDQDNDRVEISVHIKPEYVDLVRASSRFWNVSGIQVNADLSGLDIRAESLISMVQGGITFDSGEPSDGNPAASNNDEYILYKDYDAAQRGVDAEIVFRPPQQLNAGKTKIMLNGFEVGTVKAAKLTEDNSAVTASVSFHPMVEEYLTENTRFWLVKPEISLAGVSGLDTLISGSQIEMEVKKGQPRRHFVALNEPPEVDYSRPGLHLKLEATESGSLSRGAPVLYRQMKVGQVQAVSLSENKTGIVADITIDEEFRNLVNSQTRFWNASGVSVSGSLTKIKVKAESLSTLIQGGIAFINPEAKSEHSVVRNGTLFNLYRDYSEATEEGLAVQIHLPSSEGVEEGTAVKYQGYPVGEVKKLELDPDLSGLVAHVVLRQHAEKFAVAGTRFWLVKPELGITGASHLETLLKGQYFNVEPGSGAPKFDFQLQLSEPGMAVPDSGVNIVLTTPRLNSIRPGLKVFYRDIAVGMVTGYSLSGEADQVLVFANIEEPYSQLVRKGTKFWNASGINIDVGLFSGASIRSESLETILAGGISFATPPGGNTLPLAAGGDRYILHQEFDDEWLNWKPKIQLQPVSD